MATATVGRAGSLFKGLSESWLNEPVVSGTAATRPLLTDDIERRVVLTLRSGRLVFGVSGSEPTWFYPTLHSLQGLLALADGWDSYDAKVIADDVIVRAAEALVEVQPPGDAPAPAVVPGPSGSVQIEWHDAGMDIEIHISASGHASAFLADYEASAEADFEKLDVEARGILSGALARLTE